MLDRKRRKPANDDETEIMIKANGEACLNSNYSLIDPPKKRIDVSKAHLTTGNISEGSPINPRKTYGFYYNLKFFN